MRLHVKFSSEKPIILPWNYPGFLQGYLYRAISKARPDLGSLLHERGLTAEGHRYKMMVFSRLFPQRATPVENGLRMTPPIHWWVSSPLLAPMQAVVEALMSENRALLGTTLLDVASVEVEPAPDFGGPVWCETMSPLVASTAFQDGTRLRKRYLAPDEPAFWHALANNLLRKFVAIGWASQGDALEAKPSHTEFAQSGLPRDAGMQAESMQAEFAVRFQPAGEWRSRLIEVQGIRVRGYEGKFALQGNSRLLLLAYEAGLGERNSQGFGMFRVLPHSPDSTASGQRQ